MNCGPSFYLLDTQPCHSYKFISSSFAAGRRGDSSDEIDSNDFNKQIGIIYFFLSIILDVSLLIAELPTVPNFTRQLHLKSMLFPET